MIHYFISEECHYLGFANDEIYFVREGGIEFITVSQTSLYTILKIFDSNQFIKIKTNDFIQKNCEMFSFLQFSGKAHQFNQNGIRINNRGKNK